MPGAKCGSAFVGYAALALVIATHRISASVAGVAYAPITDCARDNRTGIVYYLVNPAQLDAQDSMRTCDTYVTNGKAAMIRDRQLLDTVAKELPGNKWVAARRFAALPGYVQQPADDWHWFTDIAVGDNDAGAPFDCELFADGQPVADRPVVLEAGGGGVSTAWWADGVEARALCQLHPDDMCKQLAGRVPNVTLDDGVCYHQRVSTSVMSAATAADAWCKVRHGLAELAVLHELSAGQIEQIRGKITMYAYVNLSKSASGSGDWIWGNDASKVLPAGMIDTAGDCDAMLVPASYAPDPSVPFSTGTMDANSCDAAALCQLRGPHEVPMINYHYFSVLTGGTSPGDDVRCSTFVSEEPAPKPSYAAKSAPDIAGCYSVEGVNYFVTSGVHVDFVTAVDECASYGATPAVINTAKGAYVLHKLYEYDFVPPRFWLGLLRDMPNAGEWSWMHDGQTGISPAVWLDEQFADGHHCSVMRCDGAKCAVDDELCWDVGPYPALCQVADSRPPVSDICGMLDATLPHAHVHGHCFRLQYEASGSFYRHQFMCSRYDGGRLAVLWNGTMRTAIEPVFKPVDGHVFAGVYQRTTAQCGEPYHGWRWIDGNPLPVDKAIWEHNMNFESEDASDVPHDCGLIGLHALPDLKLNDYRCDGGFYKHQSAICEHLPVPDQLLVHMPCPEATCALCVHSTGCSFGFRFACDCSPGWTGALCDVAIDECDSSPCRNKAVCTDGHDNYTCTCLEAFGGADCSVQLGSCGLQTGGEQAASSSRSLAQNTSSIVLIVTMALLLLVFAVPIGDWTLPRVYHVCMELPLLIAHCLLLVFRNRVVLGLDALCDAEHAPDYQPPQLGDASCALLGAALHYLYTWHFVAMLAEAVHNYTTYTYVYNGRGILSRSQVVGIVILAPVPIVFPTALFSLHGYYDDGYCWINYDYVNGTIEVASFAALTAITVILHEATTMVSYAKNRLSDDALVRSAGVNARMGIVPPVLSLALWLISSVATYASSTSLTPFVLPATAGLAAATLAAHTAGSHTARRVIHTLCCCMCRRARRQAPHSNSNGDGKTAAVAEAVR